MLRTHAEAYDLIGIGFGPSNLALAIALHERDQLKRSLFLEAKPDFAWHPDMLISGSDMQVSFMKDLVSLRNPRSEFSFVNYLHEKGRLSRFINRKTFFPSRHEFNDYLAWVAARLPVCQYDSRVIGCEPLERAGRISALRLISESADGRKKTHLARNMVLAPGGQPYWPEELRNLRDLPQAIHSHNYLSAISRILRPGMRVAVIGGGQSAAEITADLAARAEVAEISLILRGRALMPADDTPFVNEIFDPEQTDLFHNRTAGERCTLLQKLAATNYAVVDADLITQIYNMLYEQDVRGETRLKLFTEAEISAAKPSEQSISLQISEPRGKVQFDVDLVIFCTGYRRDLSQTVLNAVAEWRLGAPARDYRLPMAETFEPAIFVQGFSEATHGLSDTLLSVLPLRAAEIAEALSPLMSAEQYIAVAE